MVSLFRRWFHTNQNSIANMLKDQPLQENSAESREAFHVLVCVL